jgi:RecA-family ATPase
VTLAKSGNADGIGFVLTPEIPYAAIDVDGCRDVQTGSLLEWGQDFLERATLAGTYAEITPSGSGIRIWGLTETAPQDRVHVHHKLGPMNGPVTDKASQVELYRRTNQYIAITGLKISSSNQLENIDRIFDWVPRWAAIHPRPKEAKSGNGQHPVSIGPIANMSIEDIDRLIEEGAPEGERSELFHGICWHFAGVGYSIEEIEEILAEHPGGIAKRYIDEGRLLVREVARCLAEQDECGIHARAILAETEGKRAPRNIKPAAGAPHGNAAIRPGPEPSAAPSTTAEAQIPSMEEMREQLLDLGFTDVEIDQMTPESARKRLGLAFKPEPESDHNNEDDDFPADDGGDAEEEENEEESGSPEGAQQQAQSPDEEDPTNPILHEWDVGDLDPNKLPPPRGKLLGNSFCKEFLSGVISPGGIGKTTLRILQALALTSGRIDEKAFGLSGETVYVRSRVLIICLEDSPIEVERRIRAMCKHYGIALSELKGWLFIDTPEIKLATTNRRGELIVGNLLKGIEGAVKRRKIDLVIIDPLVDAHELDENAARHMNYVCALLVRMCIRLGIAIDLPQHTRKGAVTPGDPDNSRGSTAIQGKSRLNYTLTVMTPAEAKDFNIDEGERRSYVRLDSAKVNIVPPSRTARWFRMMSEPLGNATSTYPEGDWIQVMEPWNPPPVAAVMTAEEEEAIEAQIDLGLEDEDELVRRYSAHSQAAKERQAWRIVKKHASHLSDEQCKAYIRKLLKDGRLYEAKYYDSARREKAKGLFVTGPDKVNPVGAPHGATT